MQISEQDIQQLVEQVIKKIDTTTSVPQTESELGNGVYLTVNEAIEAAKQANGEMKKLSLEARKKVIENMRKISLDHAEELANLAVQETGLGNVEDKIAKNILAA